MGQEGVLLGLVKAVHLVHEQDRAPPLAQADLRLFHRRADILDPGQHCGKRDKGRIHRLGQNQRQGGLAGPRRPPQDHGMQLTPLQCLAKRFAVAHQMLLPHVLVQRGGTQACRKGLCLPGSVGGEQVVHCCC